MRVGDQQAKAAPLLRRRFFLAALACAFVPAMAQAQEPKRFDLALKAGELPKEQRI